MITDTIPKVVHDTIYIKGADALDILNKTNDFYNHAWDKLVLIVTIAIGIVGIIVPFVIHGGKRLVLIISNNNLLLLHKSLFKKRFQSWMNDLKKYTIKAWDIFITSKGIYL